MAGSAHHQLVRGASVSPIGRPSAARAASLGELRRAGHRACRRVSSSVPGPSSISSTLSSATRRCAPRSRRLRADDLAGDRGLLRGSARAHRGMPNCRATLLA